MTSFFVGGFIGCAVIILGAAVAGRPDVMGRMGLVLLVHVLMCVFLGW